MTSHRKYQLIIAGVLLAGLLVPTVAWAVDLLINGRFESFQSYNGENWRGYVEKYGQGWHITVLNEDGLHFMDSDTFGQFLSANYGVPYLNYKIEGNYSQAFASRRAFNYVLYQTINTTIGQDYALGGKIVTFYKGSGPEINHTKIFKRIGVDPTGGTDHTSPNILWTDWDATDNAWTSPALAYTASTGQATLFIQINNTEPDVGAAYLNTGYIDNFKFELAAVAALNLPAQADPGAVNVSWSVTIPDPSFWSLWGYDVQYKDDAVGTWQTIQEHNGGNGQDTSYVLTAKAGKTYTFRVRPWQQHGTGDAATTAMPGIWQEKSVTIGNAVIGRVINHMGIGLSGVTVSIDGTSNTTTSETDSTYALATGGGGNFNIVASSFEGLVAPPVTSVSVPPNGIAELDLMLRPSGAAQGLINNDFETSLFGWTSGGSASASTGDRHTGQRSLLIANNTSVSQANSVTGMDRPLVSFWYKSDSSFTVEFLNGSGAVASKTLSPVSEWTYASLDSGLGENYSGQVGARFTNSGGAANIYIDEVSIGEGPLRSYLPLILRD
ncbi:MAG: fibronectin type III domain-containing protein [Anaerolineaceae bacterium]|nr:fibronectin type III domain-containing protein [Anaerolineaceae bacterium]MCB9101648.1 fibronectin type III domain-containing protein [Anaerolineales bacterium]